MFAGSIGTGFARNVGYTSIWGDFGLQGRLYHQNPQNVVSGFGSFGSVDLSPVSLSCQRLHESEWCFETTNFFGNSHETHCGEFHY